MYTINFYTHTFYTMTTFLQSIFVYTHFYTVTKFMQGPRCMASIHEIKKLQKSHDTAPLNINKIYTILRFFCQFYFSDWNGKINKSYQYVLIICQIQVTKNYFYTQNTVHYLTHAAHFLTHVAHYITYVAHYLLGQVMGRMCQVMGCKCQVIKKQSIKYDKGSTCEGEVRLGQWFVLALLGQVMG